MLSVKHMVFLIFTKPVAKPRTRWEEVVERNTSQILGIRGWSRRAEDTEEWNFSS
jgi:hypothetical protein